MISEPDFEEISLFDLSDKKDPPEAIKENTKTEIPAKEEIKPQEKNARQNLSLIHI